MSWSIGYDMRWKRDVGYAVPAYCDHPDCNAEIDRGLGHVCCGEPYGGEHGCGLFFCVQHGGGSICLACRAGKPSQRRINPEHPRWIAWKLLDRSWEKWRRTDPEGLAWFCRMWAALEPRERAEAIGSISGEWQDENKTTGGNHEQIT